MTYDDAIRNYGIDKPDMRLPAMVSLTDELTPRAAHRPQDRAALPVLGFVIPSVGELSGTARKRLLSEIRAIFGDCGLDFLDVARLKTNADFAPLAENHRSRARRNIGPRSTRRPRHRRYHPQARHPRRWNHDPQWIWKRVGALRLQLAQKFADKHKLFEQPATASRLQIPLGHRLPHVRVGRGDQGLERRAPSLHLAARGRHQGRPPHLDKGAVRALAYDIVLNGTELGSGSIRIHRQDVQAEIFRSLGMTDEEAKEPASASSSTRSSTAPRPTAASPSASTASS
jgi:aspartyl-tRNA synthetase